MLLGALLACLPTATPTRAQQPPTCVEIRLPESTLWASFEVPEWTRDAQLETRLCEQYGHGALTAGRFGRATATLRHLPASDGRDSRAWREELGSGERFEVGVVACLRTEQRLPGEGRTMARFTALPVVGGHAFQLHINSLRIGTQDSCPRDRFEEIVRSWRLQSVRRGRPSDLPRAARDELHLGLQAWPSWDTAMLEGEAPTPTRLFARAELLWLARSDASAIESAHERARSALSRLETPTRDERALLCACEDALGRGALERTDAERSARHLERAARLASDLSHSGRGAIELDFARALVRLQRHEDALDALARALAAETRLLLRAREEPDFAPLRATKRFRELVHLAD